MTFTATTQWEARANGDTANGGGFDPALSGVDLTLQDAAEQAYTDLVIDGSDNTKITSAGERAFIDDDKGNVLNLPGTQTTGNFTDQLAQIVSVAAGVAQMDRAMGTTGSTGGDGKLGGAALLDDALLEIVAAGNTIHVKNDGTHTSAFSVLNDGLENDHITVAGYNSTRGDVTRESDNADKPLLAMGANTSKVDNNWDFRNLRMTTTSSNGLFGDTRNNFDNIKSHNYSTSANRQSMRMTGGATGQSIIYCEGQSDNGYAIDLVLDNIIMYCYIHDSASGLITGNSSNILIDHCVFERNTIAINFVLNSDQITICHNTFYSNATALSAAANTGWKIFYNLFDNNTTAINFTSEHHTNVGDFNNFTNNGTDKVNYTDGPNSSTLAPAFVAPDGIAYTDGDSDGANPSVLSSTAYGFTATDVGRAIDVTGGTGVTVGDYLIVSESSGSVTVDKDMGAAATDVAFNMPHERDFNVGANMDLELVYPSRGSQFHATIGALPRDAGGGGSTTVFIPRRQILPI